MQRFAAPGTVSADHHHGESETAIFIRSGHPEFVFFDGDREVRVATGPGDYVFVPPYLPHREENPDPATPAELVIARSTQETIVVNLPALYPLRPEDAQQSVAVVASQSFSVTIRPAAGTRHPCALDGR